MTLDELVSAIEPVAKRLSHDEQHRKAQVEGVHNPLQLSEGGPKVATDRGKRGRDDRGIECDHKCRQRHKYQYPGLPRFFARFLNAMFLYHIFLLSLRKRLRAVVTRL